MYTELQLLPWLILTVQVLTWVVYAVWWAKPDEPPLALQKAVADQ